MPRPNPLCLLLLGVLGAGACGTSRLVERNQYGGVLALVGFDRQKAMQNAHVNMASHCGPGAYTIFQEGETVVGSQTQESDEIRKTKQGTVVKDGGSKTTNMTEWRLHYQCTGPGAAGPTPAAFAPPAQPYGPPQAPPPGYPPQQPYPQQPYPPQPYPAQPYPQQPYPAPAPAPYQGQGAPPVAPASYPQYPPPPAAPAPAPRP